MRAAAPMNRDEARIVLRWVRHYAGLGRIGPADLAAMEADCARAIADGDPADGADAQAAASGAGTTLSQVLHALGGALLAAAAIAAVLVLFPDDHTRYERTQMLQAWTLGAMGAGGAGIGLALLYTSRNRDLADAFLVAGLACLAMAGMPSDDAGRVLAPLAMAAAVALPIVRRGSMLAALAGLAFAAAAFRTFDLHFQEDTGYGASDLGLTLWLLVAALHAAAIAAGVWMLRQRWLSLALAAEAIAIVLPVVLFIDDVLEPSGRSPFFDDYGGTEILLALVESVFVAAAILRREAPLLVAAAFVISIDAVVFAFDVGGQEAGVVSLLLVAGAVLGLGTLLRNRWSRPRIPA